MRVSGGKNGAGKTIAFEGRQDSMVKLKGYRVQLDEIESALEKDSANIKQASVVVIEDQLIAFVVPTDLAAFGGSDKAKRASQRRSVKQLESTLPHFMTPAAKNIIPIHAVPTTASGKTDRKALKTLFAAWFGENGAATAGAGGGGGGAGSSAEDAAYSANMSLAV